MKVPTMDIKNKESGDHDYKFAAQIAIHIMHKL